MSSNELTELGLALQKPPHLEFQTGYRMNTGSCPHIQCLSVDQAEVGQL